MRKIKQLYKLGDTKLVTKFLWLPLTIYLGSTAESRWWEHATVEYVLQGRRRRGLTGRWFASRFIDVRKP